MILLNSVQARRVSKLLIQMTKNRVKLVPRESTMRCLDSTELAYPQTEGNLRSFCSIFKLFTFLKNPTVLHNTKNPIAYPYKMISSCCCSNSYFFFVCTTFGFVEHTVVATPIQISVTGSNTNKFKKTKLKNKNPLRRIFS